MDENSEAHMETDVSSTTDDVPESQQVTGSHRDVETVIVVEKIKEEGDCSVDSKEEQPQGAITSSASTSTKTSPQKQPSQENSSKKSPVKENYVSNSLLQTPININESQIVSNLGLSVPVTAGSPVKAQPESSGHISEQEPKLFPINSTEKPVDSSPIKISLTQDTNKTPLKEVTLVSRSLLKVAKSPEKPSSKEIAPQKTTPEKHIQDTTNIEASIEKSPKVLLQETSPNKANSEIKLQDVSISEQNSVETSSTEIKVTVESSNKEIVSAESTPELQNSTINTPTKESSMSESINSKSKDLSHKSIVNKENSSTVNGADTIEVTEMPSSNILEDDLLNDSIGSSDISEKDHNKSISRELKSLINSAKESKIISECTQLTTKTRKSRSHVDTPNTSLNVSLEPEKTVHNRRGSTNSQISNSSEKSDLGTLKRSMRSQNPDFVNKCKQFLISVTSKVRKDSDEAMSEDEPITSSKEKTQTNSQLDHSSTSAKKKKISDQPVLKDKNFKKSRSDAFCWRCHWTVVQDENDKAHPPLVCSVCPRAYHYKCLSGNERKIPTDKNWVCPDCLQILHAEGSDTRSPAMKKTSLGMLCDLLKYALERMMDLNGVEPFMRPVDRTKFPDYDKYVIHPMDLEQMKQNINNGHYGSTEAFIADAQWILHNSIIFNTCEQAFLQSKLTGGARALVRSCRSEMGEIEACPECYAAAHARKPTWFTDVCSTPHILLWAKLKGFPYWPAKGMTVNSSGLVDARFFGAHDRAWVPAKDCFLFSEKDPNNFRSKRQDILDSMQEAEQHIRNISRTYGKFVYPPFKTQFEPTKLTEQLKMMIPSFEGEIKIPLKDKPISASPLTDKEKRRSNSKGSKSSTYDGDGSDSEDTLTSARCEGKKQDNKESGTERLTKVDAPIIVTEISENILSRKRRRSNLEEAVMTVIETSASEVKKKKTDATEQKKVEQQEPSSSKEEKAKSITKREVAESTSKKKTDTSKSKNKDEEPSSSTAVEKESLRVTPIKLVALPRQNKQTPKIFTTSKVSSKPSTPSAGEDKTPQRRKSTRSEKSSTGEKSKEDKAKALKRRNSKSNKSLNSSFTPKTIKTSEKKADSNNEATKKELEKESKDVKKKDDKQPNGEAKKSTADSSSAKGTDSPKIKDRLTFDDDTSLAVLARKNRHPNAGWPTISNVVSLSATTGPDGATVTSISNEAAQDIEVTVEASTDSSVFTPTSTDSVCSMQQAASKLQKLREDTNSSEPVVGRVGVRAFARMTSPNRGNDSVEVEIKAEPIDLEEIDAERHNEKMDLMTACKLRPVAPGGGLRSVRINRCGPSGSELRPRARKTFPSGRRPDTTPAAVRSDLTVKNSMVYIPIQPPVTQPPPPRTIRPAGPRPAAPQSVGNNTVNTMTTPLKPSTQTLSSPSSSTTNNAMPSAGQVVVPTVGHVPTTVHTVPLMTSVNGQWMFSLQPVMSVGGVDNSTTSTIVNGLPDRGNPTPTLVPITQNSASAPTTPAQPNRTINESNTPSDMPRLYQRPPLQNPFEANPPAALLFTPSSAGPLTAKLNQNAVKLSAFFRTLLEDCLEKLDTEDPTLAVAKLKLQLEQTRWRHQQEIDETKQTHELMLREIRQTFEKDQLRLMSNTKRAAQVELEAAVKLAKSKQWCANCYQEAQFYCCWNTSYCDYPCQRVHWPQHAPHCAQRSQPSKLEQLLRRRDDDDDTCPPEPRLQPQPENLPKSTPPGQAPTLTVGGKLAPTRVFTTQDAQKKQSSIIVSMVEDNTGNQTMKCVGTYKPSQSQEQMPPLIVNKRVINDDAAKKMVTSGGYLIVGSGNNAAVITPAPSRRPHAIHYFP